MVSKRISSLVISTSMKELSLSNPFSEMVERDEMLPERSLAEPPAVK